MRQRWNVWLWLLLVLGGLGVQGLLHAHADDRHHQPDCSHEGPGGVLADASVAATDTAPEQHGHASCPPCAKPLTHVSAHGQLLPDRLPLEGGARASYDPTTPPSHALCNPQRGPPEA